MQWVTVGYIHGFILAHMLLSQVLMVYDVFFLFLCFSEDLANLQKLVSANREDSCDKEEYLVEKIVGEIVEGGEIKYLVKWVGYTEAGNTAEPLENLQDNAIFQQYIKSKKNKNLKKRTGSKKSTGLKNNKKQKN